MKLLRRIVIAYFFTAVCIAGDDQMIIEQATYTFDYGDSAYDITFETETRLHWRLVKGEYDGLQEDRDTYYISKISDSLVFVSWVEASGLGLYNVLDLKNERLITHARHGDKTYVNTGTVVKKP